MSAADLAYADLLSHLLNYGYHKSDRTGTGTLSTFGYQLRFNLREGFPLLTTKRVHWKSIAYELLWFLTGSSNIRALQAKGVSIWDEWADADGELGPVYGVQWRRWQAWDPSPTDPLTLQPRHIDQILRIQETLRSNPDDRRLLVSAWNVGEIDHMALPPCHYAMQFYSVEAVPGQPRLLSLAVQQRSADVFLGLPFNIASYALLLTMMAHVTGHQPFELVWHGGDTHLYLNHIEQATLQLSRTEQAYEAPRLRIARQVTDIDDFRFEDFELVNYRHHPAIPAPVAV